MEQVEQGNLQEDEELDCLLNSLRDHATQNSEHKAHDPRKHFITMAKKYYVDEYAIKKIVGHTITDITEKIYTDRDLQWLTDEISKIP